MGLAGVLFPIRVFLRYRNKTCSRISGETLQNKSSGCGIMLFKVVSDNLAQSLRDGLFILTAQALY